MTKAQELCVSSSLKYGVNEAYKFHQGCIDPQFYEDNKEVLDQSRGAGYWLWKPYCIHRVMQNCKDGDVLIYSDSGCEWVNNVHELINPMDQDILFFSNGHQHIHWCKMDVLEAIIPGKYSYNNQQVQASVIVFKVSKVTRDFVKEWLLWCQMPGFIDDSPSKLPNDKEFAEHRHDQAILTCLQIKYGYKLHWWPDKLWYESQKYKWPDRYPAMIKHHRKRNNEWQ
jgi:hypothetical protein